MFASVRFPSVSLKLTENGVTFEASRRLGNLYCLIIRCREVKDTPKYVKFQVEQICYL